MLFEARFWPGIADGSITMAFRRWKQPRAVAGHVHRTPGGRVTIDSVAVVDPGAISGVDARLAGYETLDALTAALKGDPSLPVYRVAFHRLDGPDPRDELAAQDAVSPDELRQITERLLRWDRSLAGPWTEQALRLIDAKPGCRAGDLAAELGRETVAFKTDVRKLKALGLTISLETGYRLSPRGVAFLNALDPERRQ